MNFKRNLKSVSIFLSPFAKYPERKIAGESEDVSLRRDSAPDEAREKIPRPLGWGASFFGICLLLLGYSIIFSKKAEVIQINPTLTPESPAAYFAKVTKVFDGDTIEIETGEKVRYIGIDTPEVYPKVQCYSMESKKENEKLVLGKTVRLEKDTSETDKYGRQLRYVYINQDFINDDLVKGGYAKVETVRPDFKYENKFTESEIYAKQNNLGLWRNCF